MDVRVLAWPASASANPYTQLLYGAVRELGVVVDEFAPGRLLRGAYDVWHLHWPDGLLSKPGSAAATAKVATLAAMLELAAARGIRRVWTVHNLRAHDRLHPRLERRFWPMLTRRLDGYISLSDAVRDQAIERFPALRKLPGFVIPVGSLRGVYPARLTRRQARTSLGIADDASVLVHLGQIRRYKNLPHLVSAFRALADPTAVLLIAGKPHPASVAEEVREATDRDPRVRAFLEFVPDADLHIYLRAADLAVLPYTDIANSGSALLSVSYDCPTLAPRKGALPELQQLVGEDWLRLYEGELATATIADALDWASRPRRTSASPPLDRLDWAELARRTVDAYLRICEGAAVRP